MATWGDDHERVMYRRQPRPAEGTDIVRLSMQLRRAEQARDAATDVWARLALADTVTHLHADWAAAVDTRR
jgi:hypothetical protein